MTFSELFETNEQKLEREIKKSDCWNWVEDYDDNNKKITVARLGFCKEVLYDLVKAIGLQPGDEIKVKGIGKLVFNYWYFELKEKE